MPASLSCVAKPRFIILIDLIWLLTMSTLNFSRILRRVRGIFWFVELLDNPIQRYAWGSLTAIPALLGKPPDGSPQAELWVGAHPSAPSRTRSGATLEELIAREPQRLLGEASLVRFGSRLPFLLKVLAAAQPLSLQAHPSREQAEAGFRREEAAGLPRDAPNRNYRDLNHKPEILCALTPSVR